MNRLNCIYMILTLAVLASCGRAEDELEPPTLISFSTAIDDGAGYLEAADGDTRAVAIESPGSTSKKHNWNLQGIQFLPAAASGSVTGVANNSIAIYVEDKGDSSHTPLTGYTKAVKYTPDGAGNLTPPADKEQYYPSNNAKVDIFAYYPGQSTELVPSSGARTRSSAGAIAFTVKADQQKLADYAQSDLMYAKRENASRQVAAQKLTFSHLLSKVTVVVKTDGHFQAAHLDSAKVYICGISRAANFNFTKGTVEVPSGNAEGNYYRAGQAQNQTIKVMTLRENTPAADDNGGYVSISDSGHGGQHGSAVVVPQVVKAGSTFLRIVLANGGEYLYAAPAGGITLAPGKAYNFTLRLTNTGITATGAIGTWGEEADKPTTGAVQY